MNEFSTHGQLFDITMSVVKNRHTWGFIDAAAFHSDKAIFDHVNDTDAVSTADLVKSVDDAVGAQSFAVYGNRNALNEIDRDFLFLIGGVLGPHAHSKFDQIKAVDSKIFKFTSLIANMKAVFIGGVRFGNGSFDRNVMSLAVLNHLSTSRELLTEFVNSPRSNNLNIWTKSFRGQLETALIITFTGGAMRVSGCSNFLRNFEDFLGD